MPVRSHTGEACAGRADAAAACRAPGSDRPTPQLQNTAPALPRVPQVTTILDVIYKRHPETHAGVLAAGVALLVPLAARRSRRILTLSEAAKNDIVHFLHSIATGSTSPRLDLACGRPCAVPEADLRRRLGLGEAPIVLTVSAKRPHKNLARLLEAIALVDADPAAARGAGLRDRVRGELRRRAGDRVRVFGLGRRRRARRPLPGGDVLCLPVAGGGIRAAGARGDGARHAGRLLADRARSRRWPPTPRSTSTPTDTTSMARAIESLLADAGLRTVSARPAGRRRARVQLGAHRRGDARELRARARRMRSGQLNACSPGGGEGLRARRAWG